MRNLEPKIDGDTMFLAATNGCAAAFTGNMPESNIAPPVITELLINFRRDTSYIKTRIKDGAFFLLDKAKIFDSVKMLFTTISSFPFLPGRSFGPLTESALVPDDH